MGIYSLDVEAQLLTKFSRVNKQTPFSWIVLVSKSLCNKAKIVTKYQILFLREKLFVFILAIAKDAYFSLLFEKIPHLSLEPESQACFLNKLKSRTRSLKSLCFHECGSY